MLVRKTKWDEAPNLEELGIIDPTSYFNQGFQDTNILWKAPLSKKEIAGFSQEEICRHIGMMVRVLTQTSPKSWGGMGSNGPTPESYALSIRNIWNGYLNQQQIKKLKQQIRKIIPAVDTTRDAVNLLIKA